MGSRLFLRYALASLAPVLALGLALVHTEHRAGLERGLVQGRAQASVIEQMAISPALGRDDLSSGLDLGEREHLQTATDLAIFSGSVARLRLRGSCRGCPSWVPTRQMLCTVVSASASSVRST